MAVKPLVLSISAKTDGMDQSSRAMKAALAEIEKSGGDLAESFQKHFQELAKSPAAAVENMSKALQGEIRQLKREAESALAIGKNFDPSGGMSSQSSRAMADSYGQMAQMMRDRAAASRQVVAAGEQEEQQLKQIYQASLQAAAGYEAQEQAMRGNADLFAKLEAVQGRAGTEMVNTGQRVNVSAGQMRSGMQQLSYQIGDVAQQFALGTPPMMIFAQQGGQVVQAIQLMGGEAKGFMGFLGGPWGAAVMGAVTVLGMVASQTGMFSSKTAQLSKDLGDNAKALGDVKSANDGVASAQSVLADMFDLTTGKLKDQNEMLRLNAQLMAVKLRAEAAAGEATAEDVRNRSAQRSWGQYAKDVNNSGLMGFFNAGKFLMEVRDNEESENLAGVMSGKMNPAKVAKWAEGRSFEGLNITKAEYLDAIARAAEKQLKISTAEKIETSLSTGVLDKDLRREAPSRSNKTRTNEQVWRDFKAALASEGVYQATGRTGFRSAIDQNQIFKAGESPLDGYVRKSRHQSWQAFDPTRASFNAEAVYRAADKAGIAGLKIVTESGGRKHLEWKGARDKGEVDVEGSERRAEEAQREADKKKREAEAAAERQKRAEEAFTQATEAAAIERAKLARDGVTDPAKLAELDKAVIDAEREKQRAATEAAARQHEWNALDTEVLQFKQQEVADAKKAEIDRKFAQGQEAKRLQGMDDGLALQSELLSLDGQFATSLKQKLDIALQLLEIDRKRAMLAIDADLNDGRIDDAEAERRRLEANMVFHRRRAVVQSDHAPPTERYRQQLQQNVGDMDEALDGVQARGMQALEDGLMNIISGTESVSKAFKRMASAIIADLARIAIQKMILSLVGGGGFAEGGQIAGHSSGGLIGFADGGLPGFAGGTRHGNGMISGPGTGTSDSILALVDGRRLIKVSNQEGIVNARAVKRYWPLIDAMNKGSFPGYAEGGLIAGVAYPSLPSAQSLRVGGGGNASPIMFDLRGAVLTADLLEQMNRISARHAEATLMIAPGLAQQEMVEQQMQRIPM